MPGREALAQFLDRTPRTARPRNMVAGYSKRPSHRRIAFPSHLLVLFPWPHSRGFKANTLEPPGLRREVGLPERLEFAAVYELFFVLQ